MPYLFFVLWNHGEESNLPRCRIWVMRPKTDIAFRAMAARWYRRKAAGKIVGNNFQPHPPRNRDSNVFRNNCGTLTYPLMFTAVQRLVRSSFRQTHCIVPLPLFPMLVNIPCGYRNARYREPENVILRYSLSARRRAAGHCLNGCAESDTVETHRQLPRPGSGSGTQHQELRTASPSSVDFRHDCDTPNAWVDAGEQDDDLASAAPVKS